MRLAMYQTRFYFDIEDDTHFIILDHTKKLLSQKDIDRGYVSREWLLKHFQNAIQILRLTKRSCLVEYVFHAFRKDRVHRVYIT